MGRVQPQQNIAPEMPAPHASSYGDGGFASYEQPPSSLAWHEDFISEFLILGVYNKENQVVLLQTSKLIKNGQQIL